MSALLLIFILGLSHFCFHRTLAGDTRLKYNCSSTSYAPNSQYEKNLNTLLSNLAANATLNNGRFYNTSVGSGVGPDTVYGLFLCRGDDTRGDCQQCVHNATALIVNNCTHPRPVMATIWYVDCMVRYSNQIMFQVPTDTPALSITHSNMTSNTSDYITMVSDNLTKLINTTIYKPEKYAAMDASFSSLLKVYFTAQCTPDLSPNQCNTCLQSAISQLYFCCPDSEDARILTPSCNLRYGSSPFYAAPPPPPSPPAMSTSLTVGKRKTSSLVTIAIIILVAIFVVLVFICVILIWRRKTLLLDSNVEGDHVERWSSVLSGPPNLSYVFTGDLTSVESLQYDWKILQNATNNFCEENKLGEGGFGSVYKGILPNGREIAVKRLSEHSIQGAEQFKNEVMVVAKLQHKNLVKLLGFCLVPYEKLLVYEYVPNKSLDLLLFDPLRRGLLDWPTRSNIIKGIARGVLYLHEDSRLKIIHRDLKASNILLDLDMNPKISDFGTARMFKVNESQANTSLIAGTFGYMAPEYLLHGEFSRKTDVYSFGVLVLEMICGKKSTSFRASKVANISAYFWNYWNEDACLEVVDPFLGDSYSREEIQRFIQIGLLCVQADTGKRPNITSVNFYLNSDSEIPVPQEPAFWTVGSYPSKICSQSKSSEPQSLSNSIQLSFDSQASVIDLDANIGNELERSFVE